MSRLRNDVYTAKVTTNYTIISNWEYDRVNWIGIACGTSGRAYFELTIEN
jgi:hypothetical protein